MKLHDLYDTVHIADSIRTLTEGANDALHQTLAALSKCLGQTGWALIGGLAVGFHARPRGTQDIDIIATSDTEIAQIAAKCQTAFKQTRKHALAHLITGVEVEIVTPEFVKDPNIIPALQSRTIQNGVPIVSAEALIALKLGRASLGDQSDIESILRVNPDIDLSLPGFSLSDQQRALLRQLAHPEHPHAHPADDDLEKGP